MRLGRKPQARDSSIFAIGRAEAVQALKFHGMSWSMLEIGQP